MPICHKKKIIFIHPSKCAGKSIEHILFGFIKMQKSQHESIDKFKDKKFKEYFKFSIVRNPYDRFVSLYFDSKDRIEKDKWKNKSFKDFVQYHYDFYKNNKKFIRTNAGNVLNMVSIDNIVAVDKILKFENLKEDYYNMLKELKIDGKKFKLPHINKSRKSKHYSFYYDAETKKIIKEMYKKDIEYFKYNYEDLREEKNDK